MSTTAVLNASTTKCPELFLVMRQFIKLNKDKEKVQINTQETRAEGRIKLLCENYGYSYEKQVVGNEHYFLITLQAEVNAN